MNAPQNNKELREMAKAAMENWLFDSETDPTGKIKEGLVWIIVDGDVVPDNEVADLFTDYPQIWNKWDVLEEFAKNCMSE